MPTRHSTKQFPHIYDTVQVRKQIFKAPNATEGPKKKRGQEKATIANWIVTKVESPPSSMKAKKKGGLKLEGHYAMANQGLLEVHWKKNHIQYMIACFILQHIAGTITSYIW